MGEAESESESGVSRGKYVGRMGWMMVGLMGVRSGALGWGSESEYKKALSLSPEGPVLSRFSDQRAPRNDAFFTQTDRHKSRNPPLQDFIMSRLAMQ